MQIDVYEHGAPGFWRIMGPHFASRELAKDLGGEVYSHDGMLWLIAFDGRAFLGLDPITKPGTNIIEWAWVHPQLRRQGVYAALEQRAMALDPEASIRRATQHQWLVERWLGQGFTVKTLRGSWTYLEKTR